MFNLLDHFKQNEHVLRMKRNKDEDVQYLCFKKTFNIEPHQKLLRKICSSYGRSRVGLNKNLGV